MLGGPCSHSDFGLGFGFTIWGLDLPFGVRIDRLGSDLPFWGSDWGSDLPV